VLTGHISITATAIYLVADDPQRRRAHLDNARAMPEEIGGESGRAWRITPRLPTRFCMQRDGSRSIYLSPANVGAMGGYSDGRAIYPRIGSSQVIRAIQSDDFYREGERQSTPVAAC
jgi:hypothetical protein